MESQERLWSIYGRAWHWPPYTLTVEQAREHLAHREAETEQQCSFTYALFDLGETELLGCVDIDPIGNAIAAVSWWVVDWLVDSPLERDLDGLIWAWIAADWPLSPRRGPITRPNGR